MEKQLISVIVPVYNSERFLEKCVRSIMAQSWERLEIILVDDGSEDRSGEICRNLAREDSRVRVLRQENGGTSAARNSGLREAKGEYISFVDSDDFILPDMLEKMLLRLRADGSQLCICGRKMLSEAGEEREFLSNPPLWEACVSGVEAIELLLSPRGHQLVTVSNRLYTRQALEGIVFPPGRICEDEFTAHEIFYNCGRISLLPESLYCYVQHGGSIVANQDSRYILDAAGAFLSRCRFLLDKGLRPQAAASAAHAADILLFCPIEPGFRPEEAALVKELRSLLRSSRLPLPPLSRLRLASLPKLKAPYHLARKLKNCLRGRK